MIALAIRKNPIYYKIAVIASILSGSWLIEKKILITIMYGWGFEAKPYVVLGSISSRFPSNSEAKAL